jgi:hypothetical protein
MKIIQTSNNFQPKPKGKNYSRTRLALSKMLKRVTWNTSFHNFQFLGFKFLPILKLASLNWLNGDDNWQQTAKSRQTWRNASSVKRRRGKRHRRSHRRRGERLSIWEYETPKTWGISVIWILYLKLERK